MFAAFLHHGQPTVASEPYILVRNHETAAGVPYLNKPKIFTFAKNNVNLLVSPNAVIAPGNYRQSEWAGACYSPDGRWLFVNIQTPGITFAITGPWHKGSL